MKIPLFKIYTDNNDIKAVSKVIKSGMNWAIGPEVKKFEEQLAKYIGIKYALVFNSGTSALHALMKAYNFGPKDEIIVPSLTFIATANAPLFVGAKPVFAEVEEKTFGLDPKKIEEKITKNTKAIMPIHFGGLPCQIKDIQKIAKKHKLTLIEDAAQAMGAKIKNQKVGTFGDSAIFSFCANKIITTGEGGAVVTKNKELYERLKLVRSHGRLETTNYFTTTEYMDYIILGYNFRLSNILATLGISQLKKINKIIKMRQKNAVYITKSLMTIKEISCQASLKDCFNVYQLYTLRVKRGKKTRDSLKNHLNKAGIMAKVYFDPVHLTSFYKKLFGYKKGSLPITERISDEVLTLPVYPGLSKKEMDYMIRETKVFFNNYENR